MKWRKEVQTTQRSFTVRNRENETKLGQENRIKRMKCSAILFNEFFP